LGERIFRGEVNRDQDRAAPGRLRVGPIRESSREKPALTGGRQMAQIGGNAAKSKWTMAAGAAALTAVALVLALEPGMAPQAAAQMAVKDNPVRLDAVAGTTLKRVTLTAKAAERLGIKTAAVRDETVALTQMVGGEIVTGPALTPVAEKSGGGMFMMPVGAAPAAPAPRAAAPMGDSGSIWVRVPLSEGEVEKVAQDRPARVMALAARPGEGVAVTAQPSKLPPAADPRRNTVALHYVLAGDAKGFGNGHRVRVELPLKESLPARKAVPYSSVIYDTKGQAWVYTSPAPLTYLRQKIGVERIEGDVALLSEGPANGVNVVTTGAMMLYGAETK
jgi:hypothetical protein